MKIVVRICACWWLVSATALLSGCGGGGSGTHTPTTPTITALPTASAIIYGQMLASSTLTGGTASANGTSVSGTFSWTTPTTPPKAGMQSESVSFTPADTTDYAR